MSDFGEALGLAVGLILGGDPEFLEIVRLSLFVSLAATALGCLVGLPLGAALAIGRFRGRRAAIVLSDAAMSLPPVVIGLMVYLALSRSGPLGGFQLLYTPAAMIIAQWVLVAPLTLALARNAIAQENRRLDPLLRSLGVGLFGRAATLLRECRRALVTAALAGFGRAIAEVGAVILVGGNIRHHTRVMTSAIALETSKGELALALALGLTLLAVAFVVNATLALARGDRG